jgi:TRAP transporter TAXI family solute receptor
MMAIVVGLGGCRGVEADTSPTRVVIAVGPSHGVFDIVGTSLAAAYSGVPNISVSTEHRLDSQTSAEALQRGEVDLALEGGRTTYLAYRKGTPGFPSPHTRLRAIAVLFPTVLHIIGGRHSGIRSVADLRGRRLFVGSAGSATEAASRVVLESHGLTYADVEPVFDRSGAIDDFRSGKLDGIFYFFPAGHALAVDAMRTDEATLVPIERRMMDPIRSRDPLLKPAAIEAGTYEGQLETVKTVGTDVLLVTRIDLPDDLVYVLTRRLFESADTLRRAHPSARSIEPERGPEAPIPLHPGAARYYRERELFW